MNGNQWKIRVCWFLSSGFHLSVKKKKNIPTKIKIADSRLGVARRLLQCLLPLGPNVQGDRAGGADASFTLWGKVLCDEAIIKDLFSISDFFFLQALFSVEKGGDDMGWTQLPQKALRRAVV